MWRQRELLVEHVGRFKLRFRVGNWDYSAVG
jgi:hypothetical protein